MRSIAWVSSVLLVASGCADSVCAPTCEKIYGTGAGECNIQVPGHDGASGQTGLQAECLDMCQEAARQPGEVGDYDPNVRTDASDTVTLDNSAQVELWAQCIEETACSDINLGYCAPIH